MSTPKAIVEARQRLAAIDAEIATRKVAVEAKVKAQEPARKKLARLLRQYGRPIVMARPQGYRIFEQGLAQLGLSWYGSLKEGVKAKDAIELIASGEVTINVGDGPGLKARGVVQRSRVPTADAIKAWKRAHGRTQRAQKALRAAESSEMAAITAAYNSGGKIEVEDVATVVARKAILSSAVRPVSDYQLDHLVGYGRPDAARHLAHAELRSKDPCPCNRCISELRQAQYTAARLAEEKRRADEERRIAQLPKREFTCPNCGETSVAVGPEGRELAWCANENCGAELSWGAIKSKRVARDTAIGLVEEAA